MQSQQYLFPKTVYCIDTNSLINLIPPWKKDVYRRDVFPAIGRKLERMIQNRETMITAIEYYSENNYTFILLGDIEEFWQFDFATVKKKYNDKVYSKMC